MQGDIPEFVFQVIEIQLKLGGQTGRNKVCRIQRHIHEVTHCHQGTVHDLCQIGNPLSEYGGSIDQGCRIEVRRIQQLTGDQITQIDRSCS